jgi:hypothetical protein
LRLRQNLLRQDQSGSAIPLGAMAIGAIVVSAALAADLGIWRLESERFQRTLDVASLNSAHALADAPLTDSDLIAMAKVEAEANGLDPLRTNFTVERIDEYTVRISGSMETKNFFSRGIKDKNKSSVKASLQGSAVAGGSISGTPLCVMSWDPKPDEGYGIQVDDEAEIRANGCRIHSNADLTPSLSVDDSKIGAAAICAVGTNRVQGSRVTPVPHEKCEPSHDPLEHVALPKFPTSNCLPDPGTQPGNSGSMNMKPGWYCNGIDFRDGQKVRFAPGTYYVDNKFEIGDKVDIRDVEGVTFILRNADFHLYTGHGMTLEAPKTGPLAGVLLWHVGDGTGTTCNNTIRFQGEGGVRDLHYFGGAIYAPACRIQIEDMIELATPPNSFTLIVGRSVRVTDDALVNINASKPYGEPICSPVGQGGIGLRSRATVSAEEEAAKQARAAL